MVRTNGEFFNFYRHGFIRVALGVPEVRVADSLFNAARTVALIKQAEAAKAVLVVFPELGLTAYSCEDLFHQQTLLNGAQEALGAVLRAMRETHLIAVVGLLFYGEGWDVLILVGGAVTFSGNLINLWSERRSGLRS